MHFEVNGMYEKKIRKTEKKIETSLLQLMKEQTFEAISIRQLIDLAEVNIGIIWINMICWRR